MWILYAYLVAEEPRLIDCVRSYRFLEVVLHGTITISSSRFFVLQKFTPFILSPALTHFACVEFVLLFSWPEMSRTCLVESRARSRSPVGLWGGPHKVDSPLSSLEAPCTPPHAGRRYALYNQQVATELGAPIRFASKS